MPSALHFATHLRLTAVQDGNVLSGVALLHTDSEFTAAKDSLVAALIVTLICIGIGKQMQSFLTAHKLSYSSGIMPPHPASDFLGLFSGVTLKVNAMHAFQVRSLILPCFTLESQL